MNARPRTARRAIACLIAAAFAVGQPAFADERESMEALRETTLNLIDGLVEQGVFTREQADKMVQAAQAKAAKTAAKEQEKAKGAPVRVQYVPESVKAEIRDQLRQEVLAQAKAERWAEPNAVPSWLDRIKWEGDIRVRYQVEDYADSNAMAEDYFYEQEVFNPTRAAAFGSQDDYGVTGNTSEDRNRFRLRARLGMLARISDDWSGGIRLATGSETDRVMVGMPKLEKRHDWQATFAYRYLGSDATLDAFTDSDFGLGGTNLKGYQLGFTYGLDPNAWLTVRYMSAESIDSFAPGTDYSYAVDLLQADINVRF